MSGREFLTIRQVAERTGAEPWVIRYFLRTEKVEWVRPKREYLIPSDNLPRLQRLVIEWRKRRVARIVGLEFLRDADQGKLKPRGRR
jgi:hypothetical protein